MICLRCCSSPLFVTLACDAYRPFLQTSVFRLSRNSSGFHRNTAPNLPSWSRRWMLQNLTSPLRKQFNNDSYRRAELLRKKRQTTLNYLVALGCGALGLSYAAVPMYKVFCQVTGIGGGSNLAKHGNDKVENLQKVSDRKLRIIFNADTFSHLNWHFKPLQHEVTVYPGETALAFYSATNPSDRPIVGISTYTVLPFEAAKYLNKIQCFCFEEQRLNPHEQLLDMRKKGTSKFPVWCLPLKSESSPWLHFIGLQVDMPVFFYIDPEYVNDPWLERNDTITLSYTFFEAKEGMKLPTNPFSTWSGSKLKAEKA